MEQFRDKLPFAKRFQDLIVYQRAFEISLEIDEVSLSFPKHTQYGGLADQMRRASKGICLTLAEGHGKNFYPGEWRRFLMMALGSAQEMQSCTEYAFRLRYVDEPQYTSWMNEYMEIARMTQGLMPKRDGK